MNVLLLGLFAAAAFLALSSMAITVRRYAGPVLALDEQDTPPPKPPGLRRVASRNRVRTPMRAQGRARARALGNPGAGVGRKGSRRFG